MESLVANYASSDDEEQDPPIVSRPKSVQTNTSSSILSSLPQPKSLTPPSSSLFQFLPQPSQTSKLSNPLLGVQEERSSGAIPTTSSSILSSLPQPKQISSKSPLLTTHSDIHHDDPEHSERSSRFRSSNSLFSSLPQPTSQPMSQSHQPPVVNPSSSGQKNRRVVQLAPLLYPNPAKTALLDEDDEDEEQERKTSKGSDFMGQAPTVTSFLSSLPAARNTATLGVQGSSGSGRKAIIETDTPALDTGNSDVKNNVIVDQNAANDGSYNGYAHYPSEIGHASNVYYDGTANYQPASDLDSGVQSQTGVTGSENSYYGNYDTYGCHNGYVDDGQYGNNWADGSGMGMQKESGVSEDAFKLSGKRGRSQVPEDIIEVKQDELMKNRPREDQTKLTGIAFGPSYKPKDCVGREDAEDCRCDTGVYGSLSIDEMVCRDSGGRCVGQNQRAKKPVSTKGKPSKLHKRKHQISSLYFDMKQKEMELSERRAKGMLTKAETQAKYGW